MTREFNVDIMGINFLCEGLASTGTVTVRVSASSPLDATERVRLALESLLEAEADGNVARNPSPFSANTF